MFRTNRTSAGNLSTTTSLESFVRQPQGSLTDRKVARLSQRFTMNFQHVNLPSDFRAIFDGLETAACQTLDAYRHDVRCRTK